MPVEIHLDGVIAKGGMPGTISASDIRAQLSEAGDQPVLLSINSEGGEVFEGVSVYEALRRHAPGVDSRVDGLAGSIASYVMLAGETITIADGGFVMTHAAWKLTVGDAREHLEAAQLLDAITDRITDAYASRAGIPFEEAKERFVHGENWFDADAAVAAGIVTAKSGTHAVEARIADPTIYSNLPAALAGAANHKPSPVEAQTPRPRPRVTPAVTRGERLILQLQHNLRNLRHDHCTS